MGGAILKDRLNQVISDVLNIQEDFESLTSKHKGWDSLAHLNLILALEEEFNIEIFPEEFSKLYIDYNAILKFIQERIINS